MFKILSGYPNRFSDDDLRYVYQMVLDEYGGFAVFRSEKELKQFDNPDGKVLLVLDDSRLYRIKKEFNIYTRNTSNATSVDVPCDAAKSLGFYFELVLYRDTFEEYLTRMWNVRLFSFFILQFSKLKQLLSIANTLRRKF